MYEIDLALNISLNEHHNMCVCEHIHGCMYCDGRVGSGLLVLVVVVMVVTS